MSNNAPSSHANTSIQYWKLSPGENAKYWDNWREGSYVSIGWPEMGDVTSLSAEALEERRIERNVSKMGANMLYRFTQMPVGSRLVINDGTHTILGVATVTGSATYNENTEDYPTSLPVRWDDLTPHMVNEGGWRRTLIELGEEKFRALIGEAKATAQTTKPSVSHPHPTILYGPPGTGKTYSTRERTLDIAFPGEADAWGEDEQAERFRELQAAGRVEFVTFHQSYGYEEFIEGIRPVLGKDAQDEVQYQLHDGVFKRMALRAAEEGDEGCFQNAKPYVLIIDEINRGNISKILGELITLLEPDKRLGRPHELRLPLAYSPWERFGVPPNLHIIGTMNTADRSIALMDVALRRRFRFVEVGPDVGVIEAQMKDNGVDRGLINLTCAVFDTINARIRRLLDRDHQIGHSHFLDVQNLRDLQRVFHDHILPLLQEYFYGAWEKIAIILGCPYDHAGHPRRQDGSVENGAYRAPIIQAEAENALEDLNLDDLAWDDGPELGIHPNFQRDLPEDALRLFFENILAGKARAFITDETRDTAAP